MEILIQTPPKIAEKTAIVWKKPLNECIADTHLSVMDKLAGKESDIKLSFENLTLDLGVMKHSKRCNRSGHCLIKRSRKNNPLF